MPKKQSAPSPHRRDHSRSLSNPFPSPFHHFGFGKKHHKSSKHDFLDSDGDDLDDDFGLTYAHAPFVGGGGSSPQKGSAAAGVPLLTARCMTCNSAVRYPRNIVSFRCENCLMVNDLEPVKDRDLSDRGHHSANAKSNLSRKGSSLPTISRSRVCSS